MKTILTLALMMSFSAHAESFSSIPSTLLTQYSALKKLTSAQAKRKAFDAIYAEVIALEKSLYEDSANSSIEPLTVLRLRTQFKNIKKIGLTAEGCEDSFALIPHWADPQLKDISEAPEAARFAYSVLKEICPKK